MRILDCSCGFKCLCRMCSVLVEVDDEGCLLGPVLLLDEGESLADGSMRIQSGELCCVSPYQRCLS